MALVASSGEHGRLRVRSPVVPRERPLQWVGAVVARRRSFRRRGGKTLAASSEVQKRPDRPEEKCADEGVDLGSAKTTRPI